MRISCCAYSFREALTKKAMSLPDFINLCADLGLDGVELTGYYFPDTTRPTLNSLKRLCFRLGLAITGTAMRNEYLKPEPDQRKAEVEKTKQWIDLALALGAPMLRVFADRVPPNVSEEQAFAWAIECFEQVIPYAESQGVVLGLETHWGLTATVEGTLRLIRHFKSDYFGVLLDPANFRDNHYKVVEQLAPYTVSVHAKSHSRNTQEEFFELDYERIFSILKNAGYRGVVAIEYEYTDPPEKYVPRFAKRLLTLRDKYK